MNLKPFARIMGNMGVSFFSPLMSGTAADSLFDINITFEQILLIAAITSLLTTGLAISKEAAAFGETKRRT